MLTRLLTQGLDVAKITKRTVDAAVPGEGRRIIWDDKLAGFGLLILPSGVKSYVFNYRNAFGRDRRITVGKHGGDDGLLTAESARERAQELAAIVAKGGDPIAEKRAMREALSVGDLFDRYLESSAFERKSATTQNVDRSRIERHLRPLVGKIPLPSLTAGDIERAHRGMRDGKTAVDRPSGKKHGRTRVTGGEGAARMGVRLLRSILSWGYDSRLVTEEIVKEARRVDVGRDAQRNTIIEDGKAYARMFKALDRLTDPAQIGDGEFLLRTEAADAIRVIALTGARKSEITLLKWEHVDLKRGILTIPPSSHKTGRKTGEARIIGLPSAASVIIARQPADKSDALVFKAAKEGAAIDLSKPWRLVRKAAGLPDEIGLHGLRHSLASHMAMGGAEAAQIMAALGHKDLSTSQKYVHFARDQRQAIAERAASIITASMSSDDAPVENVVPMDRNAG